MRHVLYLLVLSIFWAGAAFAQPNPGDALVIDYLAGSGGHGILFSVDQTTGDRTIISDFGDSAQGPLGLSPSSVTLDYAGNALVIDSEPVRTLEVLYSEWT